MIKKMMAVLIVAVSLCMLVTSQGFASESEALFTGDGTVSAPYLLESAEDLVRLAQAVNEGNSFQNQVFYQTKDIDMKGVDWTPIGTFGGESYFYGIYNGGGHVVSNLFIGTNWVNPGFFGMLGGTVMNLGLTGTIKSTSCAAAFASHADSPNALILNCWSDMSIAGDRAGGLVDNFNGRVVNSWTISRVKGKTGIGGVFSYFARVVQHCRALVPSPENVISGQEDDYAAIKKAELLCQETAEEMNQWIETHAIDYTALGQQLAFWAYADGDLCFSGEMCDIHSLYLQYIASFLVENINDIMLWLTAVIGFCAICILLGRKVQKIHFGKVVALLGAAIAIIVVVCSLFLIVPLGNPAYSLQGQHKALEHVLLCGQLAILLLCSICLCKLRKEQIPSRLYGDGYWRARSFFFLFLLTQVWALYLLVRMHGEATGSVLFQDRNDSFMDFFHSLCTAKNSLGYLTGAIYPPICYVIFKLFGRLVPDGFYLTEDAAFVIRTSQEGYVSLLFFLLITIGLTYYVLNRCQGSSKPLRTLGTLLLMTSAPFLFALERGNNTPLAFVCLGLYFAFNKHKNHLLRETAMIALATATALKMFPGIFFLIPLLERDYKRFVRGGIYTVLLFFLPFSVFGGFSQIGVLLSNLFGRAEGTYIVNNLAATTTVGFEYTISNLIGLIVGDGYTPSWAKLLGYVISALLLACAVRNNGWKRMLALAALACGVSVSNRPYVLLYMLMPLMGFLNDRSERRAIDGMYLFCFLGLFSLFPSRDFGALGALTLWSRGGFQHPTLQIVIQGWSLLAISLLLIVDTIKDTCERKRLRL